LQTLTILTALLDSINGQRCTRARAEVRSKTDNDAVEDANDNVDVSDPDDIDRDYIDSINVCR